MSHGLNTFNILTTHNSIGFKPLIDVTGAANNVGSGLQAFEVIDSSSPYGAVLAAVRNSGDFINPNIDTEQGIWIQPYTSTAHLGGLFMRLQAPVGTADSVTTSHITTVNTYLFYIDKFLTLHLAKSTGIIPSITDLTTFNLDPLINNVRGGYYLKIRTETISTFTRFSIYQTDISQPNLISAYTQIGAYDHTTSPILTAGYSGFFWMETGGNNVSWYYDRYMDKVI